VCGLDPHDPKCGICGVIHDPERINHGTVSGSNSWATWLGRGAWTPTRSVDHIIPRCEGGTDDRANLRGLCHTRRARIAHRMSGIVKEVYTIKAWHHCCSPKNTWQCHIATLDSIVHSGKHCNQEYLPPSMTSDTI
jgi:hypothetical protein